VSRNPPNRKVAPKRDGRFMKPSQWYGAALVMPVIGIFMAVMEASGVSDRRLRNPVPAMGEFVKAECVTHMRRGRVQSEAMHTTYEFVATGYVKPAEGNRPEQISPKFTGLGSVHFVTRAECEAALPAAYALRAPRQLWFERDYPYEAMTTLDEPNSWRLLLIGLFGIPFFVVGRVVRHRQRNQLPLARGITP
jgi:hypothetical protein